MKTDERKLLCPTRESPKWRCSQCAWSAGPEQRVIGGRQVPVLQASKRMPICATAAIESAFLAHECERYPKQTGKASEDVNKAAAQMVREATKKQG